MGVEGRDNRIYTEVYLDLVKNCIVAISETYDGKVFKIEHPLNIDNKTPWRFLEGEVYKKAKDYLNLPKEEDIL